MPKTTELPRKIGDEMRDIWQKVPKEEQLDLKNFARSKAVETCSVTIIFATTIAAALNTGWLLLVGLAVIPLVYQVVTAKVWDSLKLQTNLQYLVASTTTKRYAKAHKVKDLTLTMIFKGSLSNWSQIASPTEPEWDDMLIQQSPSADVWISLFPGHLVIISEGDKGAKLEFFHSIATDFRAFSEAPLSETESPQLFLETHSEGGETIRWTLSAPHPTTLLSFEKRIHLLAERERARLEKELQEQLQIAPSKAFERISV